MDLLQNFEYNIFPKVVEYVDNHKIIDAKTALLIFLTDTVRNAKNYDVLINNVQREKEINKLYPRFTNQILDMDFQYRGYAEEFEKIENALRELPDLVNDYIRGNYSTDNIGKVREMLEICESDIFPAFNVLNKFDVPEVQEINDAINKLREYSKSFHAYEIYDIENSLEALRTTTFKCFRSVLETIKTNEADEFGEIPILYKEILENTGKEKTFYNTESPIELMYDGVNNILVNLTDPDRERVNTIENLLYQWFVDNKVDTKKLSEVRESLVHKPTLSGILAYVVLIQSLGNITRINPKSNKRLDNVVEALGHMASLVDFAGQPQIVEKIDKINQIQDKHERIKQLIGIYEEIASKFDIEDIPGVLDITATFYNNVFSNSRYIPMMPRITQSDDIYNAVAIDRRLVLSIAATTKGVEIAPFLLGNANKKTTNADKKTIANDITYYLDSFLGKNSSKKQDTNRIDVYKSTVAYDLELKYAEKLGTLFGSVKNKILANIPDDVNNAEVAFLQAASRVWKDQYTTNEEREIIERLIPPSAYIDFVNSAAKEGMIDVVEASLKQPTPKELCATAPDKYRTPDDVTKEDIAEQKKTASKYLVECAKGASFENGIATAGFNDQYKLVSCYAVPVQVVNRYFEGYGKVGIYSDPSAKSNNEALDIKMGSIVEYDNGNVVICVHHVDSKSNSNANMENGSSESNLEQAINVVIKYNKKDRDKIDQSMLYLRNHLDEVLPKYINKRDTPVAARIAHKELVSSVASFNKYIENLPVGMSRCLDINSLKLDNPKLLRDTVVFQFHSSLDTTIDAVHIDTNNKKLRKYSLGRFIGEIDHISNRLFQGTGIKKIKISPSIYVYTNGFASSLALPTAKKQAKYNALLFNNQLERE